MRCEGALLVIGAIGALAFPPQALAEWTAPVTVGNNERANPVASGALGGSIILKSRRSSTVLMSSRSGATFGPFKALGAPDPFEKVWAAEMATDGEAVVLRVRKHKPTQRIRATLVQPDGSSTPSRTISDRAHSATAPTLDVAPDGTAVAAWQWHDRTGWRVQAAIRRPGRPRFDAPQTVSAPAAASHSRQRQPWIRVAAGVGGRAALTWQNGRYAFPESPLHLLTTASNGVFGPEQQFGESGGLADVALAIAPSGDLQVAYLIRHFASHEGPAALNVSHGPVGMPLPTPVALASGGTGTSLGVPVAVAFSQDETATLAWVKPGAEDESGGTLDVYTRPATGTFAGPQRIATGVAGLALAGGPGDSAVLAWMHDTRAGMRATWTVHAVLRRTAGGSFSPDETISDTSHDALWPSVAMTPQGDVLATWLTDTAGADSGRVAAAIDPSG